jgi:septum formation protein
MPLPPVLRTHKTASAVKRRGFSSLVLASGSPRRSALLVEAGFEFESVSPRVAEKFDVNLTLRELTTWNAIRKGTSVARAHPDKIVLAADTLIALDEEIIGKPAHFDEAVQILRRLSGRTHEVCSAVFICHLKTAKSVTFCEISHVRFRYLSNAKIESYLAKIDPLDKAGAYAAQGSGAGIIAKINGSYTNVVGLPMEKTVVTLAKFGVRPKKVRDYRMSQWPRRAR